MSDRVQIRKREPSGVIGYTTVHAIIDGGYSGTYTIANTIVDTPAEIEEILAQSDVNIAHIDATKAGND